MLTAFRIAGVVAAIEADMAGKTFARPTGCDFDCSRGGIAAIKRALWTFHNINAFDVSPEVRI